MRCLVTGGAGFIGSHLVDLLASNGHQVAIVDDFSSGKLSNLQGSLDAGCFDVIEGNICDFDFDAFFSVFKPEVVFHLAAQIDVRRSVTDPLTDATTNILASIRLAEAARLNGVRKIIHTSSGGSIYGEPTVLPVDETVPIDPRSQYAVSKASSEYYFKVYGYLYGLESSFIAPSNVYGPRQNPDGEAGVVAIFAKNLLEGKPTRLFGGGTNTRDYVYVSDVARAFYLASGGQGNGERFNIGTGVETSDRTLHTLVARTVGVEDSPLDEPARLGDVARSALDPSKAKRILGWTPEVDLAQGVERTVEYFKAGSTFN